MMNRFAATLLFVCSATAVLAQSTSPVTPLYEQIHKHVYAEMQFDAPSSDLTEDEQYAFVRTYCSRNEKSPACANIATLTGGPAVLAFNHDTRAWRAVHGIATGDMELDKDGVPKVLTTSGNTIVAVVESTNPLYYTAEAGAVAETELEAITEIQTLLDALGTIIPGIVALAADLPDDVRRKTNDLNTAVTDAKRDITCVTEHRKTARRFGDRVETRRAGSYAFLKNTCPGVDRESLDLRLDALERAAKAAGDFDFCSTTATAMLQLVEMPPTDVAALRTKFNSIVMPAGCDANLRALLGQIGTRLQGLEAAPADTTQQGRWRNFGGRDARDLRQRAQQATEATALVTSANALTAAEARTKVLGLARDIERFEERLLRSIATPDRKTPASSILVSEVADFFVVPRGPITVVWDHTRSRTLDVKKALPFDDGTTRRPDSVTSKFEGAPLFTSLVDFNVSLAYTPLTSPVFGTETVPAPTAENPNATQLRIAKTGEEARGGKLGVFVSLPVFYRSASPNLRRIGFDIGAGVDTDTTPAVFLGASWKLTRAIRLGAGRTWQRVNALDGQKIGDVVPAADGLRPKQEFDSDWYASFSFSLGSLRLFKDE